MQSYRKDRALRFHDKRPGTIQKESEVSYHPELFESSWRRVLCVYSCRRDYHSHWTGQIGVYTCANNTWWADANQEERLMGRSWILCGGPILLRKRSVAGWECFILKAWLDIKKRGKPKTKGIPRACGYAFCRMQVYWENLWVSHEKKELASSLHAGQRFIPNRSPPPAFTPPHTNLLNFSKSVGQSVGQKCPTYEKRT